MDSSLRNMPSILLLCMLIVGWMGCDLTASKTSLTKSETERFTVETDRRVYSISAEDSIHFSAVNNSSTSLFQMWPTHDDVLEVKDSSGWKTLGSWYFVVGTGPVSTRIPPGEEALAPIWLNADHPIVEGTGEYRMRMAVYSDEDTEHLLPIEERVSNVFRIVE